MNLEDQVCSLELAKRLKELGLKQDSYFYWINFCDFIVWHPVTTKGDRDGPSDFWFLEDRLKNNEAFSAFTVAELGEMLPRLVVKKNKSYFLQSSKTLNNDWRVDYSDYGIISEFKSGYSEKEANARAEMIIYLIENGFIDISTIY